jgi:hypothetical protein
LEDFDELFMKISRNPVSFKLQMKVRRVSDWHCKYVFRNRGVMKYVWQDQQVTRLPGYSHGN